MQDGMTIQVLLSGKTLLTAHAGEWLNLLVNVALVHLQASFAVELPVALVALEAVLPGVKEEMRLQPPRLNELLAAVFAFVRLLARVDLHVTVEGALEGKGKVALRALEWFLAGVDATVFVECTAAAEVL